jgi:hypothetical protein
MTLADNPDAARAAMLQTWRQHWALDAGVAAVPSGTYDVYLYVVQDWDDPNPATVTFTLEGQDVTTHTPGRAGSWSRLGPFSVTVTDGELTLGARQIVNLAGIEIWTK